MSGRTSCGYGSPATLVSVVHYYHRLRPPSSIILPLAAPYLAQFQLAPMHVQCFQLLFNASKIAHGFAKLRNNKEFYVLTAAVDESVAEILPEGGFSGWLGVSFSRGRTCS
ncbi:unnamed protein product [Haemonchus placei]|uniref:Uncharacterized protein n=1 Tax=Haemonchus placei TaxID=6290 RepID=A0A0N4WI95_HAEPC|nr:unnamed protein product [Haemonchus placei]